ncbi:CSN12 [Candida pseudojiufengensis]|uniref:CSN12 n=1 Tax=Candida pseudojiufengensis TaxID=497109 RepID=UPI0022255488|nr:CSN12 [Candida pseudojiufengensis]KAI5959646.1 CSN12 [Candida pseudojiufengensis]
MSSLQGYIEEFNKSVKNHDAKSLRQLTTINPGDIAQIRKNFELPTEFDLYSTPEKFKSVIISYLNVLKSIYIKQSLSLSFENLNEMCNQLIRTGESQDNWIMPVIISSCEELILIYKVKQSREPENLDSYLDDTTDDGFINGGNNNVKKSSLEELIFTFRKGFNLTFNDKNLDNKSSKRNDVYFFASNFVKYCFKMGKLALAKSIMKAIKTVKQQLPKMSQSINTRKHGITFLYFQSLIALDDGDYNASETSLDEAMDLLQDYKIKDSIQLQQILIILVPLKLFNKGKLPNKIIWTKFKKLKYLYEDNFLKAIKEGNLKKYDECMEKFENFLLKRHLYIIMELLRQFTQLNLFKKITFVINDTNNKSIQLNAYQIGFEFSMNYDQKNNYKINSSNSSSRILNKIDILEIENIIANLITNGFIRGFLSNSSNVVVLSKSNPFPKIYNVKLDRKF